MSNDPDPETLPDAPASTETTADPTSKKRKKSHKNKPETTQFSIRSPDWAYIRLQHLFPPFNKLAGDLDIMTAQMHLTAALSSFLGLHGSAIAFDILKLEGQDVWIRVQAEDRAAVVAATGGWVNGAREGWRVVGWSCWNVEGAGSRRGEELFE